MASELKNHVEVTTDAFDLMGTLLTHLEIPKDRATPSAVFAMAFLGTRLANDLRCVERLATEAYPSQALTLTSSMYETAWTIAYVGSDDSLATAWRDHDDPIRSFCDAWSLTRGGLIKLGTLPLDIDRRCAEEYRIYSQLKMGGHANPVLERRLGVVRTDTDVLRQNGPDTSEAGIRAACFAMLAAIHVSFMALTGLVRSNLSGKVSDDLVQQVIDIGTRGENLGAKFAKRWPPDDPFPGKWRV